MFSNDGKKYTYQLTTKNNGSTRKELSVFGNGKSIMVDGAKIFKSNDIHYVDAKYFHDLMCSEMGISKSYGVDVKKPLLSASHGESGYGSYNFGYVDADAYAKIGKDGMIPIEGEPYSDSASGLGVNVEVGAIGMEYGNDDYSVGLDLFQATAGAGLSSKRVGIEANAAVAHGEIQFTIPFGFLNGGLQITLEGNALGVGFEAGYEDEKGFGLGITPGFGGSIYGQWKPSN